jgi:hypothetical protein
MLDDLCGNKKMLSTDTWQRWLAYQYPDNQENIEAHKFFQTSVYKKSKLLGIIVAKPSYRMKNRAESRASAPLLHKLLLNLT